MWVPVSVAADEAQVHPRTVLNWLGRDPSLGRKIGGRWRVDPDRLQRILEGTAPLSRGR